MVSVKSSKQEKLMGSQVPSVRIVPGFFYTDGEDAIKILEIATVTVDLWQKKLLRDWMGQDDNGIWSSQTCGLSVPRQNGKTLDVIGRSIAGMILYAEKIIYTAHLQKTSTETFQEIKSIFEHKSLKKYVKEFRAALGREEIICKNGGRIVFIARTRNGGRGQHGDLLIFDEAQELTSEQQASFLPAISASKNPQTIYLGTPPDEKCDGRIFRNIRDKAIAKESESITWTEFSIEEIGDVTDKKRWAETNPALGIRLRLSTIANECEQMDRDTFARERLGWWSPVHDKKENLFLDIEKWEKCKSKLSKPNGKTAYGIKFSPDGSQVALAGAVIDELGKARISLIEYKSTSRGIRWLAEWCNERYDRACCIVIDGRNGVDLLIDKIKETWKAKNAIIRPNSKEMIACASLLNEYINEEGLTWFELQEVLDYSARTAIKRPISGGFGFGGENCYPIEACSLALYGAKTSKRDPKRKMRIG